MAATKNIDLPKLVEQFGSEEKCRAYLEHLRWPDGVRCLRCQSDKISRIKTRNIFECAGCEYQFSVRTGTIFHDSKLPLWKWFLAVYMMVQSKKGVSANQLKRMLGVSYKTAWYLCHRIREAMRDEDAEPLTGVVEADETFIGGKQRGIGSGTHGKVVVMGAASRGGEIRLAFTRNRRAPTVRRFLAENVSNDADALYTDKLRSYKRYARQKGIPHGAVSHTHHEWVNGKVHTNTIENVWSLLDRSIIGAYHKVSTKHLPRYLEEIEWRYNNRDNPYLFRDTIRELANCERLDYQSLVSAGSNS